MATCVVDTVALKGFSSVLNLGITGEVHDTDRPLLKAVKYAAKKQKKLFQTLTAILSHQVYD